MFVYSAVLLKEWKCMRIVDQLAKMELVHTRSFKADLMPAVSFEVPTTQKNINQKLLNEKY